MFSRTMLLCLFLVLLVPTGQAAKLHRVNMVNFAFVPETLMIQMGDTVLWVNQGSVSHTSTSGTNGVPDGVWDSGLISPGDSFAFAFDTLHGNFPYYCTPHWPLGMVGLIISNVEGTQEVTSPVRFGSFRSYPNPFSAKIEFELEIRSAGTLEALIFNSLGVPVRHLIGEYGQPGNHVIIWDGRNDDGENLPAGVYLLHIISGQDAYRARVTLIR